MTASLHESAARAYCDKRGLSFVEPLGAGAFKGAYLVSDGRHTVALKVAELYGTQAERLAREAEALQTCNHPSIATLKSVDTFAHAKGTFWIAHEEFLSGGTLQARVDSGPVAPAEARRLGMVFASVLEHLDERRLVHRDIKPANILFRADGVTPVLTDFGIVRILEHPTLTQDFLAMGPGTPFFAAPEQLLNQRALIDWRTDQFGLAVTLSTSVLGRHPFQKDGQSHRDAIIAVAARQPLPEATQLRLSELGLAGLSRAMEPWPVNRHRRPTDLWDALDRG
jgi:serine/threonine protein kinase